MTRKTVNEVLILMKAIRARLNELQSLRSQVSTRDTHFYGDQSKNIKEPQYDVKLVDKKIVELANFLLLADSAIKNSNAVTHVSIDINIDSLLKPLE